MRAFNPKLVQPVKGITSKPEATLSYQFIYSNIWMR